MGSEFRDYADFPRRGFPLRSWIDRTRLMGLSETLRICPTEYISPIADAVDDANVITDSYSIDSIINDAVDVNSIIC